MPFHPADPGSLAAFLAILVVVIGAFLVSIYRSALPDRSLATQRVTSCAAGLVLWLGLLSGVVASGVVAAQPMPCLLVLFSGVNLISLWVALSPVGGWIIAGSSIRALILFQAFRLPLELVLHSWAQQGTIPPTMTWTGANWDIATGLAALALGPWSNRSSALAWIFNLLGFCLLLNVMRVVMLSSPLPMSWRLELPLQLPFHLPYALIVPVAVGGALIGHVVLTRALLSRGRTDSGRMS